MFEIRLFLYTCTPTHTFVYPPVSLIVFFQDRKLEIYSYPKKGTVVNPKKGTVVNPKKGNVVNTKKGTVVNPKKGTVVNPKKVPLLI